MMVSNSSDPPGAFYLDPAGMALPGLSSFSAGASAADDPDKKIRKPYTTSKSRQIWTDPEHDKFLEALQLFDRDWKKIEAFIGSKTVIQIRSHAQKYFLKVQKSGGNEHLPPPRPKRKAAHPYPHKASKSVPPLPQMMDPVLSSASLPKPKYLIKQDMPCAFRGDLKSTAEATAINSCNSDESTPSVQSFRQMPVQANKSQTTRVLPDFARVYGYIGSVFDPNVTGHLNNLKQMDPIDVETALLLMRNLSINLTSPDFEDHRKVLSTYDLDTKDSSYDVVGIYAVQYGTKAIQAEPSTRSGTFLMVPDL